MLDALALAVAAAAPAFGVLAAALAVVGVTSVAAQVLVPFASALAAEEERGRVVGRVMSGLLLGILLARTVAGLVSELGGWRLIYGAGGGRDAGAGRRAAGARCRRSSRRSALPYPRLLALGRRR